MSVRTHAPAGTAAHRTATAPRAVAARPQVRPSPVVPRANALPLGAAGLGALQRSAGNAAVAAMLAGRVAPAAQRELVGVPTRPPIDATRPPGDAGGSPVSGEHESEDRPHVRPNPRPTPGPVTRPEAPTAKAAPDAKAGPAGAAPPAKATGAPATPASTTAPSASTAETAVGPRPSAGAAGPTAGAAAGAAGPTAGAAAGAAAGLTAGAAPGPVAGPAATPAWPPPRPQPANPTTDPALAGVTAQIHAAGHAAATHPTPQAQVGLAQAAAVPPAGDAMAQAHAAHVEGMAATKPGGFDKAAFVAAVRAAVAKAAPTNLDEADTFATSGRADGIRNEVKGQVAGGKQAAAGPVEAAVRTPSDPSVATPKEVTPLPPARAPPTPQVDAAAGMPGPAPGEQLALTGGPAQADRAMTDAQVTPEHLERSNEPALQEAAAARNAAHEHAAQAPAQVRAQEAATRAGARTGAAGQASAGLAGLVGAATAAHGAVAGTTASTTSRDEAERARITAQITATFEATKTEVEAILGGIDAKVTTAFDAGEGEARREFTARHQADMAAYKDERYSGITGAARWAEDLFTGLPPEADRIFQQARAGYEARMTEVIGTVADVVAGELETARTRIETGRTKVRELVAEAPRALRQVAQDAAAEVGDRFDELTSAVDAKQQSLVDDLAARWTEARNAVDAEITAAQEENRGLVDKAMDAVGGALRTVLELKAMFVGMLARAASAFTRILDDPIGFIGSFMTAVKQGFLQFGDHILTHLQKGLTGWLFGALAEAGIEIPESFDLKGILKLLGSLMGLTWSAVKARIAKLAPGVAAVIDAVESKIEVFQLLATQGLAGVWGWIKEKVTDLKSLIMDPIMDFVRERIVMAGISWVIGALNPAGALVKIVQALVGVVTWISERGAALVDLVNTVIDAVVDIADGGAGGVPGKIEAALGKSVPLVISFIANLLGLGGISEKIRSIVQRVQAPVTRALDAVIKGALKSAGPIIRAASAVAGTVKAKVAAGKAWVGEKVAAGKAWVGGKVAAGKAWVARLLRKTFTVGGQSHTLKAAQRSPGARVALTVASEEKSVEAHQQAAAEVATARNRPELAQEAIALIARAAQVEGQVAAGQDAAGAHPALAELAAMIQRVWARIGYQGEPPRESFADDGRAGVLGEVGRHADQGSRGYRGNDTREEKDRLESEHVVPRAWILAFVDNFLGLVRRGSRADRSLYRSMTTVMLYKGAADYKTERTKRSDNTAIAKLKALTSTQVGTNPGKNPAAVAAAVRSCFDGPIASRIQLTKQARDADHAQHARPGPPAPADSVIEGAAMRQLLDVLEFVARSLAAVPQTTSATRPGGRSGE